MDNGNQNQPSGPEYGVVSGTITDPFGGPLSNVKVSLTGGPTPQQATTDGEGEFNFVQVQTGSCSVQLARDGFNDKSGTVSVSADQTTDISESLDPESLPSTATLAARIVGYSGARLDFEVDVAVVNESGRPYSGLSSTAFAM